METEVGKIADFMKNTSEKRTPLQVNLDQFMTKAFHPDSCILWYFVRNQYPAGR